MTIINIQFADESNAAIVGYYDSSQSSAMFPNMGTLDTSDPRWKSYFDVQPLIVQPWLPAPTDSSV